MENELKEAISDDVKVEILSGFQIAQTFETRAYERFRLLPGNRPISKSNLKNLKDSMEKHGFISNIVVNENWEIIDGQTRKKAAEELNIPVRGVVIPGLGIKHAQAMGNTIKGWSLLDNIKMWADTGNQEYQKLLKYQVRYRKLKSLILVIYALAGMSIDRKFILSGKFKIYDEKKATKYLDDVSEITPYFENRSKAYRTQSFKEALLALVQRENFNLSRLLDKIPGNLAKISAENTRDTLNSLIALNNKALTEDSEYYIK